MMNAWKWGTSLVLALVIALLSGPGVAEIVPPESNCFDGFDNNFDGRTDCADPTCAGETGPPTTCGVGECAAAGNRICQSGFEVDTCTPGAPSDEVCDNLDNNCNGSIDDVFPEPSTCGVGACQDSGEVICQGGALVDTCTPDMTSQRKRCGLVLS